MLQHDEDLQLLPIVFEKLKLFTKVRKHWRYIMERMNLLINFDSNLHNKKRAFRRWSEARKSFQLLL